MTLLRLSISRNFSDSFFFLPSFFFPFFFTPIHFPCIGPSWRRNETGTKRERIGTDFCSCPFPWYCDCAISDELVKLAQSAVRLHVAHPSFLHPLRLHPYNPLVFSVGWPVNRKRYKPRPRFWESSTPLALYSNHDNRNTDPGHEVLRQFWKISSIPLRVFPSPLRAPPLPILKSFCNFAKLQCIV